MPFWLVKPSTSWPAAKLARDRHRRTGEVDVVEIGHRQRRVDRGRRLVLGIGERSAAGRDDRRIVDRRDA